MILNIVCSHNKRMQCFLKSLDVESQPTKMYDEINFKHTAILKVEVSEKITVTMVHEGEVNYADQFYYGNDLHDQIFGTKTYVNKEKLKPFTCYIMRSAESDPYYTYDPDLTENGKIQATNAAVEFETFIPKDTYLNGCVSDLQRSYSTWTHFLMYFLNKKIKIKPKLFLLPCIHEITYGKKNCDTLESRYSTKLKTLFELKNTPNTSNLLNNMYSDEYIVTSIYDNFYKSRFSDIGLRRSFFRNKRCRNFTMLGLIYSALRSEIYEDKYKRGEYTADKLKVQTDEYKKRVADFEKDIHLEAANTLSFKDLRAGTKRKRLRKTKKRR